MRNSRQAFHRLRHRFSRPLPAVVSRRLTETGSSTSLGATAVARHHTVLHGCIRGEDVILQDGESGIPADCNLLTGTIQWITAEGPLLRVGIDCGFELTALVTRSASEEMGLRIDDRISASIKVASIHLMAIRDLPLSREGQVQ